MAPLNNSALSMNHAANRSHFEFCIRTVPDDTFTVTRFKGKGHGLSTDFEFTIDLNADSIKLKAGKISEN